MLITSKQNPVVKELSSLKDKKGRKERGAFLVEGPKMVSECVKSGLEIVRLVAREDYAGETFAHAVVTLGPDAFRAVCDEKTPQGIAAEVKIPARPLAAPAGKCLLLDGIQDPANVGAIIRTAVAAGYAEIYLADCTDPFSPKAVRSSMSGVFYAKLMQGSRAELLNVLSETPIIAADMQGENVFTFTPPARFCIAIGNEGRGLSDEVRSRAAYIVKIPMDERTESLNAAVSAGILMYQLNSNSQR